MTMQEILRILVKATELRQWSGDAQYRQTVTTVPRILRETGTQGQFQMMQADGEIVAVRMLWGHDCRFRLWRMEVTLAQRMSEVFGISVYICPEDRVSQC